MIITDNLISLISALKSANNLGYLSDYKLTYYVNKTQYLQIIQNSNIKEQQLAPIEIEQGEVLRSIIYDKKTNNIRFRYFNENQFFINIKIPIGDILNFHPIKGGWYEKDSIIIEKICHNLYFISINFLVDNSYSNMYPNGMLIHNKLNYNFLIDSNENVILSPFNDLKNLFEKVKSCYLLKNKKLNIPSNYKELINRNLITYEALIQTQSRKIVIEILEHNIEYRPSNNKLLILGEYVTLISDIESEPISSCNLKGISENDLGLYKIT